MRMELVGPTPQTDLVRPRNSLRNRQHYPVPVFRTYNTHSSPVSDHRSRAPCRLRQDTARSDSQTRRPPTQTRKDQRGAAKGRGCTLAVQRSSSVFLFVLSDLYFDHFGVAPRTEKRRTRPALGPCAQDHGILVPSHRPNRLHPPASDRTRDTLQVVVGLEVGALLSVRWAALLVLTEDCDGVGAPTPVLGRSSSVWGGLTLLRESCPHTPPSATGQGPSEVSY